jgi:hypothetical protein
MECRNCGCFKRLNQSYIGQSNMGQSNMWSILYINSLSPSVSQSWARAGTGHGLGTHWARAGLGTHWARHGRPGPGRGAQHGQTGHGRTRHGLGMGTRLGTGTGLGTN